MDEIIIVDTGSTDDSVRAVRWSHTSWWAIMGRLRTVHPTGCILVRNRNETRAAGDGWASLWANRLPLLDLAAAFATMRMLRPSRSA